MRRNENRRKYAREHLPALMRKTGGLCHWCGVPITMRRTIEDHEVLKELPKSITWRDTDGTVLFACLASVDHVRPLEENGGNQLKNLVASCMGCNGKRSKEPGTIGHEFAVARLFEEWQEAQALKPLFRWLRRVEGQLKFGKEVRCFVEEDGKVVADYKHTDIVRAIKGTQARFNQLTVDRLGKGVHAKASNAQTPPAQAAPTINFTTAKTKRLAELKAGDVPPGLDPEGVAIDG